MRQQRGVVKKQKRKKKDNIRNRGKSRTGILRYVNRDYVQFADFAEKKEREVMRKMGGGIER